MDNTATYEQHLGLIRSSVNRISRFSRLALRELFILLLPLVVLMLGQLIYLFSPSEEVNNYFTDKRNLINMVFVKNGWGWNLIIFTIFCVAKLRKGVKIKPITIIRLALITGWWWVFTQWCFGLPIMDRLFVLTGGKCSNIPTIQAERYIQKFPALGEFFSKKDSEPLVQEAIISSSTCRSIKGEWTGGHDPSGHVFLLSISWIFLMIELTHSLAHEVDIVQHHTNVLKKLLLTIHKRQFTQTLQVLGDYPEILILFLCFLWTWMLLMTGIYFHSMTEKLFGLFWCYLGIVTVYIAPRFMKNDS
ncbi:BA75_01885T0 [Komagataella pastoris]|uniref:BA75_01885T0 n=1 Tax=Komagataella pastoris TaxID=4922 RepID=A0A1B2JBW9_PICPA|nr:BA75_01885T0 [Komagataella pastoris]